MYIISDIMIIRTKHELRKTWEICPTAIRLPAVLYYYSHNYWENTVKVNWYSYSEHLEKRVIGTKLLEVRCENNKKELFKAI